MAAYTLRNEASFLRPEFEHARGRIRRSVRGLSRLTGAFLRREIEEADRKSFRLVWRDADEGQRKLLLEAWETTRGALPMNYTPLGDVDANAVEVWFRSAPQVVRVGLDAWSMTADLEEDR